MNFQKMNLAQLKAAAARLTSESDPALKNIRPDAAKELKVVEQLIIEKTAAAKQKVAAATAKPAPAATSKKVAAKGPKFLFVPLDKSLYRITFGSGPDSTKVRKLRTHSAKEIDTVSANSAKFASGTVKVVKVTKQLLFTPGLPEKFADVANKLVGKQGKLVA